MATTAKDSSHHDVHVNDEQREVQQVSSAQWFAAVLLLEAEHPRGKDDRNRLFEKRVVLFNGGDEAEAARKASEYCDAAKIDYENEYGEMVEWRCLRIIEVSPLYVDDLGDGVEVYSELLDKEPEPAKQHRSSI
jgi:hypothetical protein